MPDMDKTGPFGNGRFGRGMGLCGEHRSDGWHTRQFHRRGGWRTRTVSVDEEKGWLEQRKTWLETQLTAIDERLQELVNEQPDPAE